MRNANNLLKFPILQRWEKWKSDLDSLSRTGWSPKVNHI